MRITYLWFHRRIIIVRWLGWDLLKHLMESHVDLGILVDQVFEFLNRGMEGLGFDRTLCGLFGKLAFPVSMIAGQSANSMFNNNRHDILRRRAISSGRVPSTGKVPGMIRAK